MSPDLESYWATMAQVLVVVALAVVVEARAIIAGWGLRSASKLRWLQCLVWAGILGWITFTLPRVVEATRPGAVVADSLDTQCQYLLSAALGVVVLGPATELFARGSAWQVAGIVNTTPRLRWRLYRLEKLNRKQAKRAEMLIAKTDRRFLEQMQTKAWQEMQFLVTKRKVEAATLSPDARSSAQDALIAMEHLIASSGAGISESQTELRQMLTDLNRGYDDIRIARRNLKEIRLKQRTLDAESFDDAFRLGGTPGVAVDARQSDEDLPNNVGRRTIQRRALQVRSQVRTRSTRPRLPRRKDI